MAKPSLMGTGEIMNRLGVSRQRAHQLTSRTDFPQPYAVLILGCVWRTTDVDVWIRDHRPELHDKEPDGWSPASGLSTT
jgi:prophage regulatory protein